MVTFFHQSLYWNPFEHLRQGQRIFEPTFSFFFGSRLGRIFKILNTELDFQTPKDYAHRFLDQSEI